MKKHKAHLIVDVISLSMPLIIMTFIVIKIWDIAVQQTSPAYLISLIGIPALFYLSFYTSLIRGDKKIAIYLHSFLRRGRIVFFVYVLAAMVSAFLHLPIMLIALVGSIYWSITVKEPYRKQATIWYEQYFDEWLVLNYLCPAILVGFFNI